MEKLIWHTEQKQIKELKATEGNPRFLTKKQAKDLEKSLKKFNLVDIPAINTDLRIISGHQRITILKTLGRGEEKIDVRVPNRKLTEEEHREYMLRANKNQGDWDLDLLANIDEALLKDVGWESEELDDIFQLDMDDDEKADKVPEARETDIKLGDMFELGNHRLLCGDATKKEDVDRLMQGEKADMVFTDPPYGIGYKYNTHKDKEGIEYLEFCDKWFALIKDTPTIFITVGWKYLSFWYSKDPSDVFYWTMKGKHSRGINCYFRITEQILIWGKSKNKFNFDTFDNTNEKLMVGDTDLRELHTCPKPIKIISELITSG